MVLPVVPLDVTSATLVRRGERRLCAGPTSTARRGYRRRVTESSAPPPGFYRDESGRDRWWDGRAWTAHVRPRLEVSRHTGPIATPPTTASHLAKVAQPPTPVRARVGFRMRTLVVVAAASGAVGLCIGIGGAAGAADAVPTDARTAPAFVALQSRFTAVVSERDALRENAAAVASTSERLVTDRRSVDEEQASLDAVKTKLDKRAKALDAKAARLKAAGKAASSSSGSSSSTSRSSTTVSYQNCTAVREAGAAPIRRGDPGYAPHLDRDGDGIGCE